MHVEVAQRALLDLRAGLAQRLPVGAPPTTRARLARIVVVAVRRLRRCWALASSAGAAS
jgi:hypothetical protein